MSTSPWKSDEEEKLSSAQELALRMEMFAAGQSEAVVLGAIGILIGFQPGTREELDELLKGTETVARAAFLDKQDLIKRGKLK